MDYAYVLTNKFSDKHWSIGLTYESLMWQEDEEKPTDASLQEFWLHLQNDFYLDVFRKKRNELLSETDKYAIQDWVQTDEQKKERFEYRQRMRDIPALYLEKMVGDYTISGEVLSVSGENYNFF
jgi:hypothetical protein